ncbi:MAG: hypothetical protein ACKVT0_03405 [Planctomycetaceae bacterium]
MECRVCGATVKAINGKHLKSANCESVDGVRLSVREYQRRFGGVIRSGLLYESVEAASDPSATHNGAVTLPKKKTSVLKLLEKLSVEAIDGELAVVEASIAESLALRKRLKGLRAMIGGETGGGQAIPADRASFEAVEIDTYQDKSGDLRESIIEYIEAAGPSKDHAIARGIGINFDVLNIHLDALVEGQRLSYDKGLYRIASDR